MMFYLLLRIHKIEGNVILFNSEMKFIPIETLNYQQNHYSYE